MLISSCYQRTMGSRAWSSVYTINSLSTMPTKTRVLIVIHQCSFHGYNFKHPRRYDHHNRTIGLRAMDLVMISTSSDLVPAPALAGCDW